METFIQRHVTAMHGMGVFPVLVARSEMGKEVQSASVQETDLLVRTMPNYDRLNPIQKINNLRYLVGDFNRPPGDHSQLRDRVLLSFFRSLQPDLIHFHFASLAQLMWWIPAALGIPYTMSLRGSDIQVNPLLSQKNREDLQAAFDHAAGIQSVSEDLWNQALSYIHRDTFHRTIYTTVPCELNPPCRKTRDGEVNFVTIGRLHWTKNLVDLLKAFAVFRKQTGFGKLTIIGNGPEMESLLYWRSILGLEHHVCFAGKLNFEQFKATIRQADGYIQSSIAEGFSNATAEAMGMGIPVFATDVGGTAEIIHDGENGFLLAPMNPEDWWKKLVLADNKPYMDRIGTNALKTARSTFSSEIHSKKFLDFYRFAIEQFEKK